MPGKISLSFIVWAATILMAGLLICDGVGISFGVFKHCGTVIGIITLLLFLFEHFIWKWQIFHPWCIKRPILVGTWKGVLKSTWRNPETDKPVDPIDVYIVIRQSFSTLSLRVITRQSSSESLCNNLLRSEDGVYTIVSIYRNTPKMEYREGSPIHHGGLVLNVIGEPAASLNGEYFTDRKSQGQIEFTQHCETIFYDFPSAEAGKFKELNKT